MTTKVTITGTGMPLVQAHRAGPGVLVEVGDIAMQFDTGRNTASRIVGAGVGILDLDAVFLTHYHSDHVVGLQDVVLSYWVIDFADQADALDIVAPNGHTMEFVDRMMDAWDHDLEVRAAHHGGGRSTIPRTNHLGFGVPDEPTEVWSKGDVRVLAGQVRHEPVVGAVGYRIESPDGVVVITGDTIVCDEVATLSQGAELNVPSVMLTHLIPPPETPEAKAGFADDLRSNGYDGQITVCDDLETFTLG